MEQLSQSLREEAEFVAVSASPETSPDPGDDLLCACAETGKADFIVTLNPEELSAITLVGSRGSNLANAFQQLPQ